MRPARACLALLLAATAAAAGLDMGLSLVEAGEGRWNVLDAEGHVVFQQRINPAGGRFWLDAGGRLLGSSRPDPAGGTAWFAGDGAPLGWSRPNYSTGTDWFGADGAYRGQSAVEPGGRVVTWYGPDGKVLDYTLFPLHPGTAAPGATPAGR